MTTILSVAEKPSVAKELAKIIGGDGQVNRRNGYSPYNHIFEIPSCKFRNNNASMKVTSVTGHVMEMEFDTSYKSWSSCQPVELFHAPILKTVKKENENIQKTLVEESRKCNTLLLWLDCDLEGENISFEVINICKAANPRLEIYRARFSALIPRDILRTLQFPDRPNEHFNDAVEARQEIDLRLGAAFTRFQTLRLQNRFDDLENTVISYGPCQFPTLGFVVERHLKIESFQPENFWSISCEYEANDPDERSGKLITTFAWSRSCLYDQLACAVLFKSCVEGGFGENSVGGTAKITKCQARPTSRYRPAPMNTIELQKRASRFLHLGSERTMQLAEALYQRGILSYPRTETDFFKDGFELFPLLQEHRQHSDWGSYVSNLLDTPRLFSWPRNGGHDDQAHPPIHPTKCVELSTLTCPDEKKIYDLVCRHFFAACSLDGIGQMTEISARIPAEGWQYETFSASGLMILERNWLDVYSKYEKWSAKKVPKFEVGQVFVPKSLMMTSGKTCPPLAISESDLISDMDRNGIGTDATIAAHISTIQQRNYAIKDEQNRFIPTKLGLALIEGYNSMGYQLNKPFLRAAMESDCQKIAKGELSRADVVKNCLAKMKDCFITCNREATKLDDAMAKRFQTYGATGAGFTVLQARFSQCGVCQSFMDFRVKDGGSVRHLFCDQCSRVHMLPNNGELSPIDVRCAICQFQVVQVKNTETQKTHTLCPHCFKNPPGPPISEEGTAEFRCFSCAHTNCPLSGRVAGTDIDIVGCPENNCNMGLRIKKNPKGGFMLACASPTCSRIWWLPKCIKNVTPAPNNEICVQCTARNSGNQVRKLSFQFSLSLAPPGIPPEATACPCCDRLWFDLHFDPLTLGSKGIPASNGRGPPAYSSSASNSKPAQQFQSQQPQTQMSSFSSSSHNSGSDYGSALLGVNFHSKASKTSTASGRGGRGGRGSGGRSSSPPASNSATGGRSGRGRGRGGGGRESNSSIGYGSKNAAASDVEQVLCQCGEPTAVNTVRKEGPNQGRLFRACSQKRNGQNGCNFFAWMDEGGSGVGNSFPGGGSNDVICSYCKQAGHYARSCPNK